MECYKFCLNSIIFKKNKICCLMNDPDPVIKFPKLRIQPGMDRFRNPGINILLTYLLTYCYYR